MRNKSKKLQGIIIISIIIVLVNIPLTYIFQLYLKSGFKISLSTESLLIGSCIYLLILIGQAVTLVLNYFQNKINKNIKSNILLIFSVIFIPAMLLYFAFSYLIATIFDLSYSGQLYLTSLYSLLGYIEGVAWMVVILHIQKKI